MLSGSRDYPMSKDPGDELNWWSLNTMVNHENNHGDQRIKNWDCHRDNVGLQ